MSYRNITFFSRFESDILADRKTITIRDQSESHFQPGEILTVARNEDDQYFCHIRVNAVTPIHFDALNEQHAVQENMTLEELKSVIQTIYPGQNEFVVIDFTRLDVTGNVAATNS
ncbi:N(4)-acetylcytidine aminohydrolase [Kistimonas scapharcae]|uniref:N(4)-acetylcytidine amidohydrolase n=1 Tax=Kistimonas scapharcae TaxID=1036133 RepID=A0ABP8V307_9GAMM